MLKPFHSMEMPEQPQQEISSPCGAQKSIWGGDVSVVLVGTGNRWGHQVRRWREHKAQLWGPAQAAKLQTESWHGHLAFLRHMSPSRMSLSPAPPPQP